MEKTEEVFNKYFNNVEFIHNKTNYENVRSLCEQEEALIQLCKKYNYDYRIFEKNSNLGGVWYDKSYPNVKLQTNKFKIITIC